MELESGQDSRRNWVRVNELDKRIKALESMLLLQGFDMSGQRRRPMDIPPDFYPFKIYQVPGIFRAAGTGTADDWLKVRVRDGRVLTTSATGPDSVGTDGTGNPDGPTYPTGITDVTLTAGVAQHWFWISTADGQLHHSAAPAGAGWANYPTIDGANIPIGYVDTLTNQATKKIIVRQFLRTDLLAGGGGTGMNWKGLYNPATTYAQYDMVYVTSGASQGTWLRIAAGSASGVDPIWPEAGVWKMIAFGVQTTTVCQGGTKSQAINALPPV